MVTKVTIYCQVTISCQVIISCQVTNLTVVRADDELLTAADGCWLAVVTLSTVGYGDKNFNTPQVPS